MVRVTRWKARGRGFDSRRRHTLSFLTNSDFPTNQTFHQFHDLYTELDLHRIMSGFHGAFATGVASQQGTLTLPDTWFRPPFWDLLMLQLLRPNSSNLPCLYSTFHLEYPLVLSRFCFEIFANGTLFTSRAKTIQMKSSMTFIQSNGWTEIDLILKQIWRRFIWRQVSFKVHTISTQLVETITV